MMPNAAIAECHSYAIFKSRLEFRHKKGKHKIQNMKNPLEEFG